MKRFLRLLAILLAIYFLLTALDNIFGLRSGSFSASAIPGRFRQSFIAIVAAILLLVNSRKLKTGAQQFVYFVSLFAVNLWYSLAFVSRSRVLMNYHKPAGLVLSLLILATLWGTFWYGLNERFAGKRK
jgi:hypothetical protein